tara:strand:- start:59000 stop:59158 length:159 start_codon:yes stop_codon:yes gene_type:complete
MTIKLGEGGFSPLKSYDKNTKACRKKGCTIKYSFKNKKPSEEGFFYYLMFKR